MNYNKTFKAQMFNRGQASKVFKEVHDNNIVACVIRNSEPYVAIINHNEYQSLYDKAHKYEELTKENKDDN